MKNFLETISSMRTAVIIFVLIAAASTAATFMPQETANRHIYGSFWFIALLVFLFISTFTCTVIKAVKGIKPGPFIMHLGMIITMAGALIGVIFGERGMIMFSEGETALSYEKEGGSQAELPFSLKLNSFKVEYYPVKAENKITVNGKKHIAFDAPGTYGEFEIVDIKRDFVINEQGIPVSKSDEWKNPAIRIKCGEDESWVFALFPEFHGDMKFCGKSINYECRVSGGEVREFISDVDVIENNETVFNKKIMVNHPLDYKGYSIYQASFDTKKPGWTGLIIKKDPGLPYIYAGFIIMTLGLFIILFKKLK